MEYFTGNEKPIEYHKPDYTSGDPQQLNKQAAGCIAKGIALEFGKARVDGQEYVFAKYRNCTNVGTLIKKRMAKSGAAVWKKRKVNA